MLETVKENFPQINLSEITYLDSAASTLKVKAAIDAVTKYYTEETANIHRGIHHLSEINTTRYEATRDIVQKFLNADKREEIIFTRGTTESVNLVTRTWGEANLKAGDEIIISAMEHHSNMVPWQMLAEKTGAKLKIIPINQNGEILIDEYRKLLSEKTKIISVVYISNSLGTINPIEEMIKLARENSPALFMVDAAQAVAHQTVDVQKLDCDFLAFSGHKIFAPTGTGVLYGKFDVLDAMPPFHGGGDMIDVVTYEKTTYNTLPHKLEAGTPHIAGFLGLGPALEYVQNLGLDKIYQYEKDLLDYGHRRLAEIPTLKMIGTAKEKASILSFVIDGIHPHDIATLANKYKIAIRTGHHCTQPLMEFFKVPATARASISIYNTKEDIDKLTESLKKIIEIFG